MAENLNIGTMINGSSNQTNNYLIEKYCYDNNANRCDTYGGLYQWDEMMKYSTTPGTKGICPTGWHLPTDAEWTILTDSLDVAGGEMKETGTSHWNSPNAGATNSSGFTGLPGGFHSTNGSFNNIGYHANFWSSSESGSGAWYRRLRYDNVQVNRYDGNQVNGHSVRCVRD